MYNTISHADIVKTIGLFCYAEMPGQEPCLHDIC